MAFVFYDFGGAGFEALDQLGERSLSGETDKKMDMIFYPADPKRVTIEAS